MWQTYPIDKWNTFELIAIEIVMIQQNNLQYAWDKEETRREWGHMLERIYKTKMFGRRCCGWVVICKWVLLSTWWADGPCEMDQRSLRRRVPMRLRSCACVPCACVSCACVPSSTPQLQHHYHMYYMLLASCNPMITSWSVSVISHQQQVVSSHRTAVQCWCMVPARTQHLPQVCLEQERSRERK